MSLDDSLLDEPEVLVRIDAQRMLASTASAGAAIRNALDADGGQVLGPLVEEHFRRGMVFARGDFMKMIERPISGARF